MGPRRLRLALLFAVLSAVFRQGSSSACTTPPTSKCPVNAPTFVDCKVISTSTSPLSCDSNRKPYFTDDLDMWDEATKVKCDPAEDKWKAESMGSEGVLSNVVCAKFQPDAQSCTARVTITSDCTTLLPNIGCQPVTITDGVDIKCPPGAVILPTLSLYFKTGNQGWKELPAGKTINCDIGGDWQIEDQGGEVAMGVGDEVVCATSMPIPIVPCQDTGKLKSACDSTIYGCAPISGPITDDTTFECTSPQNLYAQPAAGPWKTATKVTCDKATGVWKDGGVPFQIGSDTNIVCSSRNPNLPAPCQDCPLLDSLDIANCGVGCLPGAPPIQGTAGSPLCNVEKCAVSEFFVVKYGDDDSISTKPIQEVKCDSAGKWMDEGANKEVAKGVCIKGYSCKDKNPITSDCTSLDKWRCENVDFSDDNTKSCVPPKKLFINDDVGAWNEYTDLTCDKPTGAWTPSPNPPPPNINNVVCAESNPDAAPILSCQGTNTLVSDCDGIVTNCDPVPGPILDDTTFTCTPVQDPPQSLYVQKESESWVQLQTTNVVCDKATGEWNEGANSLGNKPRIICANEQPVSCTAGVLPVLDCNDPSLVQVQCEAVPLGENPSCPAGKTLYFLKDSGDINKPNTLWMEAKTIKCKGADREIEYDFGAVTKKEPFDLTNDKIVCATSNPNPATVGCRMANFKFKGSEIYKLETPSPFTPAGKAGACAAGYKVISCTDLTGNDCAEIDTDNVAPVCGPDGKWKTASNKDADKILCRIRNCKLCNMDDLNNPSVDPSIPASAVMKDGGGECLNVDCTSATNLFLVSSLDDSSTLYRYYSDQIKCSDVNPHDWRDKDGHEISKAQCIQEAHANCHNPKSVLIDTQCPTDVPGCTKIILPNDIDKFKPLACDKKIILIRKKPVDPTDPYWDEVSMMKCGTEAKWEVTLASGGTMQLRDYQNTVVCADANPNPRPLPTTTTKTPPREICELCIEHLPPKNDCKMCDGNITNIAEFKPINGNTCNMKAKDGTKLIFNNNNEVTNFLECGYPPVDEYGVPEANHVWWKADGTAVTDFKVQKKEELKSFGFAHYSIIAVALLVIGGMGIGCVAIYFRMRKQPSVRERKKKERGVTKKYTSANVVRTGGKSSGGSREAGKSMEPAKSKAEENFEDAPTLKL